jgi:flagellar basal body-associated protein FliL
VLHPSSGSGLLWMLLVAAAVLVLGGGAGIAVSRSRRRAPQPSACRPPNPRAQRRSTARRT